MAAAAPGTEAWCEAPVTSYCLMVAIKSLMRNDAAHIRRPQPSVSVALLAVAAAAALAAPARADLPPIDQVMAYGAAAVGAPTPERVNLTSPRTVELLAEALRRPGQAASRRAELVADLGATQLPAAVPAVTAAATDESPIVRSEVARALGRIGDPAAAATVKALANDPDPLVRAAVVRAASELSDTSLVPAGLKDADPAVVAAALSAAGKGDYVPAHADAIAAALPTLSSPLLPAALEAMGRIGLAAQAGDVRDGPVDSTKPPASSLATGGQVVRDLGARHGPTVATHAAANRPVAQRVAAERALGQMRAEGQAKAVVAAAADPHPVVRREAALALPAVLPPADASAAVVALLDDRDPSVRTAAARAVARAPSPEAVAPLVRQLADEDSALHAAARAALVAVGEPAAAPAMAKLLDHADPRRREDASYVLGRLRSRAAYDRHVALTKDADWTTAAQAAQSLGLIGGDPATATGPALADLLTRATAAAPTAPDAANAMEAALVAAGRLGYHPIVPAAVALFPKRSNAPTNARAAALWAWGVLGADDDARVAELVPPLLSDPFEEADVKREGLKALGNRKAPNATSIATNLPPSISGVEMLALAHWVGDRARGTRTPFSTEPVGWRAEVSITDQRQ